jgi:hypothetical protein
MRIKATWNKKDREISAEDTASALAFIAWRLGMNSLLNLENEGFETTTQAQRLSIIEEMMAFLIHIADRTLYGVTSDEDRATFINALAKKLADHVQDNARDSKGPGDHRGPFVEKLNQRLDDYAGFSFADGKPGFNFTLYLGHRVAEMMGDKDNKWIADHVQAIEVPEILKDYRRGMEKLGIAESTSAAS